MHPRLTSKEFYALCRLDAMGALRQRHLVKDHQFWRILTSPCLHAGFFHIILNLSSVIFIGVHMEQEFGACKVSSPNAKMIGNLNSAMTYCITPVLFCAVRIGIVYVLSAFTGSSVTALFLQDRPSVASSAALFGLLGATLSGLIWNWKVYTKKVTSLLPLLSTISFRLSVFCVFCQLAALMILFIILMLNAILGLMPYVSNFSNIGGFISGFLLGFVILFKPQTGHSQSKVGIFDYDGKTSAKLRPKLDRPVVRIVSLVIFILG